MPAGTGPSPVPLLTESADCPAICHGTLTQPLPRGTFCRHGTFFAAVYDSVGATSQSIPGCVQSDYDVDHTMLKSFSFGLDHELRRMYFVATRSES
jgi:hypothetical protein